MRVGPHELTVRLERWPGQQRLRAGLPGMERFGGGWRYKLGVDVGALTRIRARRARPDLFKDDRGTPRGYWSRTVVVNLLFGLVSINVKRYTRDRVAA